MASVLALLRPQGDGKRSLARPRRIWMPRFARSRPGAAVMSEKPTGTPRGDFEPAGAIGKWAKGVRGRDA